VSGGQSRRRKSQNPAKARKKERFLSARADPFAGSEWGRKRRPAPFGMTVRCLWSTENEGVRSTLRRWLALGFFGGFFFFGFFFLFFFL